MKETQNNDSTTTKMSVDENPSTPNKTTIVDVPNKIEDTIIAGKKQEVTKGSHGKTKKSIKARNNKKKVTAAK